MNIYFAGYLYVHWRTECGVKDEQPGPDKKILVILFHLMSGNS